MTKYYKYYKGIIKFIGLWLMCTVPFVVCRLIFMPKIPIGDFLITLLALFAVGIGGFVMFIAWGEQ